MHKIKMCYIFRMIIPIKSNTRSEPSTPFLTQIIFTVFKYVVTYLFILPMSLRTLQKFFIKYAFIDWRYASRWTNMTLNVYKIHWRKHTNLEAESAHRKWDWAELRELPFLYLKFAMKNSMSSSFLKYNKLIKKKSRMRFLQRSLLSKQSLWYRSQERGSGVGWCKYFRYFQ